VLLPFAGAFFDLYIGDSVSARKQKRRSGRALHECCRSARHKGERANGKREKEERSLSSFGKTKQYPTGTSFGS